MCATEHSVLYHCRAASTVPAPNTVLHKHSSHSSFSPFPCVFSFFPTQFPFIPQLISNLSLHFLFWDKHYRYTGDSCGPGCGRQWTIMSWGWGHRCRWTAAPKNSLSSPPSWLPWSERGGRGQLLSLLSFTRCWVGLEPGGLDRCTSQAAAQAERCPVTWAEHVTHPQQTPTSNGE